MAVGHRAFFLGHGMVNLTALPPHSLRHHSLSQEGATEPLPRHHHVNRETHTHCLGQGCSPWEGGSSRGSPGHYQDITIPHILSHCHRRLKRRPLTVSSWEGRRCLQPPQLRLAFSIAWGMVCLASPPLGITMPRLSLSQSCHQMPQGLPTPNRVIDNKSYNTVQTEENEPIITIIMSIQRRS